MLKTKRAKISSKIQLIVIFILFIMQNSFAQPTDYCIPLAEQGTCDNNFYFPAFQNAFPIRMSITTNGNTSMDYNFPVQSWYPSLGSDGSELLLLATTLMVTKEDCLFKVLRQP